MKNQIVIHQTVKGPNGCENVTYRQKMLAGGRDRKQQQYDEALVNARSEWEGAGYEVLTQWRGLA